MVNIQIIKEMWGEKNIPGDERENELLWWATFRSFLLFVSCDVHVSLSSGVLLNPKRWRGKKGEVSSWSSHDLLPSLTMIIHLQQPLYPSPGDVERRIEINVSWCIISCLWCFSFCTREISESINILWKNKVRSHLVYHLWRLSCDEWCRWWFIMSHLQKKVSETNVTENHYCQQ